MITKKYLDELTYEIIGSAIEVHKIMGRGLLESVYHQCLKEELNHRKINFLTEMKVPVIYKEKLLDLDFRCDLYVENSIVVELKAVQDIVPAYEAQLLTYMKVLKKPQGLLINFFSQNITKSMKPFVNEYFNMLTD